MVAFKYRYEVKTAKETRQYKTLGRAFNAASASKEKPAFLLVYSWLSDGCPAFDKPENLESVTRFGKRGSCKKSSERELAAAMA